MLQPKPLPGKPPKKKAAAPTTAAATAKVNLAQVFDGKLNDAAGNVVIDAVKDGQYVGPRYVLEELKKKI